MVLSTPASAIRMSYSSAPGAIPSTSVAVGAFGAAPQPTTLLQSIVFGREPLPGEERSVATMRSATGTHAVHQQVLRGAPVEGALYQLHQDDNGYMSITGRPTPV